MWSMMSSPLIIGTDVRTLSPANLAIYSNPAVIAINQDPNGNSAQRIWRYECSDVDENGMCEYALWQRGLHNGDVVIALINGGASAVTLNATLYDIFIQNSLGGTSKPAAQLSESWDVYDLWGNRMSNDEAAMVLNGTAPEISMASNSTTRYNATETSYAAGLAANATALFGKKVGTIAPHGTWSANIPRHSTGFYRLRQASSNGMRKRDEL